MPFCFSGACFSLWGFRQAGTQTPKLKHAPLNPPATYAVMLSMLAAVTHRNRVRVVEKTLPHLKPGWALVRVRLAGICNTDIEIFAATTIFEARFGHEFVGDVVRVTGAKDRAWIGRRIVGEINLACAGLGFRKPCAYCRRGIPTQCERRRVLGIIGHDGAFAEYLALPVVNLHRVPLSIPEKQPSSPSRSPPHAKYWNK